MTIEIESDSNCLSALTLSGVFFSFLLCHGYLFLNEGECCPLNLTRKYVNLASVKVSSNLR